MQRVSKLKRTFPKAPSPLITFTRGVLQSVGNNTKFPALKNPTPTTPVAGVPTWTDVNDAVDALEAQEIKVVLGGTKADTSLRDDLQSVLDAPVTGMLVLWVDYIMGIAGTNATDQLSSGFQTTKQPERIDSLDEPQYLRVAGFNKGSFHLKVNPVENAVSYKWVLKLWDKVTNQLVPNVLPIEVFSTAADTLTGALVSGQWYQITAIAQGSRGVTSTESNPLVVVCM